ncbi:Myb_DNA-bind_4 domain-containing protein [Cephalotus follicularis]|uniref:Myb_DNA-bind_4 domain-containing protein n=1 Tax=Cephalotus follicularis TaxID=3775 RepID=A0A1Q3AXB0_CEPFO|nr:Myb_DNA-bind_4 domain-containing protein [Cephalotus follicularis]
MALELNDMHEKVNSPFKGVCKEEALFGSDDRIKTMRHPSWTSQETLILINAKKVVENRIKGGCRSNSPMTTEQIEPKWDSISSYCKQHRVNQRPVKYRKRWSNLLGDFKKIKSWESRTHEEAKLFWRTNNECRKERKSPTFFDREVYHVLDGRPFVFDAIPLPLVKSRDDSDNCDGAEAPTSEELNKEEAEAVFDSSQHATSEDCLFSEVEQSGKDNIGQSLEKETVATESPTNSQGSPLPYTGAENELQ